MRNLLRKYRAVKADVRGRARDTRGVQKLLALPLFLSLLGIIRAFFPELSSSFASRYFACDSRLRVRIRVMNYAIYNTQPSRIPLLFPLHYSTRAFLLTAVNVPL